MARPLRCRLRLHRWEYRENPETQEHYQICIRCNAYRDRGTSPWAGSGGAWGSVVERMEAPPAWLADVQLTACRVLANRTVELSRRSVQCDAIAWTAAPTKPGTCTR